MALARQPRFLLPGYAQHVIHRCNNRDVIFAAEGDFLFYLDKLAEGCRRHGCRVHA